MLKLKDVRRVDYDAPHNAFTDLVRWKDEWYLTFRAASTHTSADGKVMLIRSPDLETWAEVKVFSTDADDRDPKLLATPERLIVNYISVQDTETLLWMHHSSDGRTWSGPQRFWADNHVCWRAHLAPDGFYYRDIHTRSGPYRPGKAPIKDHRVMLCRSTDGLEWEKVSDIWSGSGTETGLAFRDEGECVALIKHGNGKPKPHDKALLAFSRPPYKQWEHVDAGMQGHGPAFLNLNGTIYAAARKYRWAPGGERLPSVTALYLLDGRMLHEFLTLPSGGDCSYAALVDAGNGEVAMSYYSSHEGATSIYIARLEQMPMPGGHRFFSEWIEPKTVDVNLPY